MKKTQKIGWQKYEDVLEARMNSPLVESLFKSIAKSLPEEEDSDPFSTPDPLEENQKDSVMINVGDDLTNEITLAESFDCWLGHTNFNITEEIKEHLNKIDGIEVLKICSRYRFFVGIGKMFDFSEVRESIEKQVINQGEKIE